MGNVPSCTACGGRSAEGDDTAEADSGSRASWNVESAEVVNALKGEGWGPRSPVVLIPGLTCTALRVEESSKRPDWGGTNIWLDLGKIALSAVVTTGDTRSAEADRAAALLNDMDADGDGSVSPDEIATFLHSITGLARDDDVAALLAKIKGAPAELARELFWKATAVQAKLRTIMLERAFRVADEVVGVEHALSVSGVRNGWVQHLSLKDGFADPEGIRVRPITTNHGLDGCDFLSKSPLLRNVTYIYGPLIKALQEFGYVAGRDFCAQPYDWRIAPSRLQERDRYFSGLMDTIEGLFRGGGDGGDGGDGEAPVDGRRVVVVSHSMGCRIASYFFHWVAHSEDGRARGGSDWTRKHVASLVTVGGPFLGAPEANRSTFMGMEFLPRALVSEQHAFELGRNFGSNPMLYAMHRLHAARGAGSGAGGEHQQAFLWTRREGVLKLRLVSSRLPGTGAAFAEGGSGLASTKDEGEAEFTTVVVCVLDGVKGQRKQVLTSRPRSSHTPAWDDAFQFVVCSPGDATMLEGATLTLTLRNVTGRFSICPVTKKFALLPMPPVVAKKTFDLGAMFNKPGGAGQCVNLTNAPFTDDGDSGTVEGVVGAGEAKKEPGDEHPTITMSLQWLPHEDDVRSGCRGRGFLRKDVEGIDGLGGAAAAAAAAAADGGDKDATTALRHAEWRPEPGTGAPPVTTYAPREMDELLYEDDADGTYRMWMRDFADDPIFAGPTRAAAKASTGSKDGGQEEGVDKEDREGAARRGADAARGTGRAAQKPPGVANMLNVYGVNLDTEIGSVYRRVPKRYDSENRLETSFELDTDCTLGKDDKFRAKGGKVFETKRTPQKQDAGPSASAKATSGDGTVPYWSCRYPADYWHGSAGGDADDTALCVENVEIDRAVHRDILKHPRFTEVILRHVGGKCV